MTSAARPQAPKGPDKIACATAHGDAQVSQKNGKLLAASEQLKICSNPACPALLQRECEGWLGGVNRQIPLVTVSVSGPDPAALDLRLDGAAIQPGAAVKVDPGEHAVTARARGFADASLSFSIRAGETRPLSIALQAQPAPGGAGPAPDGQGPAAPARARPVPISVWVAGGAGLVGLGAFAFFGTSGQRKLDELDSSGCKPSCEHDRVQEVRDRFLFANLSLGVGVVGVGIAAFLFATRPERGSASRSPSVSVGLSGRDPSLSLSGRF